MFSRPFHLAFLKIIKLHFLRLVHSHHMCMSFWSQSFYCFSQWPLDYLLILYFYVSSNIASWHSWWHQMVGHSLLWPRQLFIVVPSCLGNADSQRFFDPLFWEPIVRVDKWSSGQHAGSWKQLSCDWKLQLVAVDRTKTRTLWMWSQLTNHWAATSHKVFRLYCFCSHWDICKIS